MVHSLDRHPDFQSLAVADLIIRLRNSLPSEASVYCEELIRRFEPLLRSTWHRLAGESEYQDFVQDVFTQLFAHLPGLRDPKAFPGYFRQIVLTVAINYRRKHATHSDVSLEELAELATHIDENILTKVFVRSYLERLPPRDRTVIFLSFFSGHSLKDIAEQLGVTEGNVRVIKYRALQSLREMIQADAAA